MLKNSYILFLMLFIKIASGQTHSDSIKTTVFNNHVYLIHTVVSGQTLFSLSKKYKCSIDQIKSWNPKLKSNPALTIGQELVFPIIRYGKQIVAGVTKNEAKKLNKLLIEDKKKKVENEKEHIITSGETIFSIAKKYNLNEQDLIKANKIIDGKIENGQKLIVDHNEITKLIKPINEDLKNETRKLPTNGIKIAEEGVAEVINTNNRSSKSLALHRSAPIGSVIQVTNEANGQSIMAKVVGTISSNGPDQEILVKLSPSAYRRLQPKDTKMRAKVIYFTQNYGVL